MNYNILKLACICIFVYISPDIFGQSKKLKIYSSLALQGTEERIFRLNNLSREKFIKINDDKIMPSSYIDLGIEYELLSIRNFTFSSGLKYAFEWNNSYRIYNHSILQAYPCTFQPIAVDGYSYHLLGSTFNFNYELDIHKDYSLKFGATLSPMFRFPSYYDAAFKYYWKLEYFFSEILPNVSISHGNYEIGLYGRIWQHRKVDRLIYPSFSGSGHPIVEEDYININPWKIGLFVKYDFPF